MHLLYETISKLRSRKVYFSLSNNRENVVTISIVVPGQRVEVDVHSDETVDIAVFKGDELASTSISCLDAMLDSFDA